MQEELIELQTQVAFQEQTISELNAALSSQQAQIERLELQLRLLGERLDELVESPSTGGLDDERPPHY